MKNEHEAVSLEYAVPTVRRRHSAFAIAGFTVALLAAALPTVPLIFIWRDRMNGGSGSNVVVGTGFFAMPMTAALLAVIALARGSRRPLAVATIILAVVATVVALWMNGGHHF